MIKKFVNGLVFGAGFAISLLAIWTIGVYFVFPKLIEGKYKKKEISNVMVAPPIDDKKFYLGSTNGYSSDFEMDRSKVMAEGPGVIKGKVLLNKVPLDGLKLRLAVYSIESGQ